MADSCLASARAVMSTPPPGAVDIEMVTGLSGNVSAAIALQQPAAIAAIAMNRATPCMNFVMIVPFAGGPDF
jgi:hypothetical protein